MTTDNPITTTGKATAILIAVCLCLALAPVLPCHAQQDPEPMFDPGGGEIRINSDRMKMQTGGNSAEFTGNVHAVQGETSVRSNRLKIFYRSGEAPGTQEDGMTEEAIERIDAEGDVIIDFRDTTARAEKAVYTAEDGLLRLFGLPARIESSDSVITGKEVTMNRNTGEVEVHGDDNGRVEAVFKPAPASGGDESERPDSGPDR
ncbi:MAG: LptA/OstA family protein [Desulfosalsimonas sp.]